MNNWKKLAIVGHSRAGKDTAALWLAEYTALSYHGSLSWHALPIVAKELGVELEVAWAERHKNCKEWQSILDYYRKYDKSRLIREAIKTTDIITGIRCIDELKEAQRLCYVDLVIWINNPRCEEDPTMTYDCRAADIMILNDSDLYSFHNRLAAFANYAGLLS